MANIRRFSPLIETYIQDMKPDRDMGAVPVKDHYFLGQADLAKGVENDMLASAKKGKLNPLSHLSGAFTSSSYVPQGFLQMIYIDTNGFDRQHYRFDYHVGTKLTGCCCGCSLFVYLASKLPTAS